MSARSVCLPVRLSVRSAICSFVCLPFYRVSLFPCLLIRLSVRPSACRNSSVSSSACPFGRMFVCLSVCLSVCFLVRLSILSLSICFSVCSLVCISVYLSICLFTNRSSLSTCVSPFFRLCLFIRFPFICLSVRLSSGLPTHPCIYLSVCLSVYLSVHLSVCLSVYLFVYLSVYLYVCWSSLPVLEYYATFPTYLDLSISKTTTKKLAAIRSTAKWSTGSATNLP